MQKRTIIHKYSVVPLLAIAAMHAAVWLGTKSLADFSRAFDVTLGLDALIPLRPEWVVIYVGTFVFWGMGLLLIARQDEDLCCHFACQRCLSSSTSSPTLSAAYSAASWRLLWDKNCLFGKYLLKSIKNSCNPLHDMV